MKKPRNGMQVLYHPCTTDKMSENGDPLAAFISHVWDERCVSLMVIDAHGGCHGRSRIHLHHDGVKPADGFCEWPEEKP